MHSRLLVPSLLRPFGEHLAALVQPEPGDVCVDVGGAGGVMPALLARVARLCVAVDDDAEVLAELRHRAAVAVVRARGDALPLRDGCAQVVTSLFSLASLPEMVRVLDPQRGRLGCALWSEPDASPHLGVLVAAYEEVTGEVPRWLRAAVEYGYPLGPERLIEQSGAGGRIEVNRIHDVVRFDGVAHYWAAMAGEDAPPDDVRHAAEARLAAYAAADGTLRIPSEAVVLTTAQRAGSR
jgi:hypothetical protein